jgi:hypothetical protein
MFDAREQSTVMTQRFLASVDAPVGHAAVDVLPELFLELRLVAHLREHAHVGFDPAHHTRIRGAGHAFGDGFGAE